MGNRWGEDGNSDRLYFLVNFSQRQGRHTEKLGFGAFGGDWTGERKDSCPMEIHQSSFLSSDPRVSPLFSEGSALAPTLAGVRSGNPLFLPSLFLTEETRTPSEK